MKANNWIASVALASATLALAATGHAAELVVGQVAPMTGLEANQGRAYAAGMQLLFNDTNAAGGANDNTFVLVRKDDGGLSDDTVSARRQLLAESRPLILAGFFGDNCNLGGYVVDFKPSMRLGSRFVELSIVSGAGKIRQ